MVIDGQIGDCLVVEVAVMSREGMETQIRWSRDGTRVTISYLLSVPSIIDVFRCGTVVWTVGCPNVFHGIRWLYEHVEVKTKTATSNRYLKVVNFDKVRSNLVMF